MRPRRATRFGILAGLAGFLGATPALASPPCPPLAVEADAELRARWPELAARVREAFDGRRDVDACARVALTTKRGSIVVEVALPDGRSASRAVSRPEDVVPTLEGLLLLPLRAEPEATPSVRESSPNGAVLATTPAPVASRNAEVPAPPADGPSSIPTRDARTAPAARAPMHLRIELSVATDARVGDGQTSLGIGARSLVEMGGWLAGFEARAERAQPIGDASLRYGGVELALLGGRRVRLRPFAIDVAAGPAIAIRESSSTTAVRPGATPYTESSSEGVVPRLLAGARLIFGADRVLRGFVGVDGEVGMARAPGAGPSNGSPGLPVWSGGLALGATVGTL